MYRPSIVPSNTSTLPSFLTQELLNIQKEMASPNDLLLLKELHAPPEKFRQDCVTLAIADGIDWNPGSGAGLYRYQGGSWKFVG